MAVSLSWGQSDEQHSRKKACSFVQGRVTHSEVHIVKHHTIKGHAVGGLLDTPELQERIVLVLQIESPPFDETVCQLSLDARLCQC